MLYMTATIEKCNKSYLRGSFYELDIHIFSVINKLSLVMHLPYCYSLQIFQLTCASSNSVKYCRKMIPLIFTTSDETKIND